MNDMSVNYEQLILALRLIRKNKTFPSVISRFCHLRMSYGTTSFSLKIQHSKIYLNKTATGKM